MADRLYKITGTGLQNIIFLMLAGMIISIVFLALWNPATGDGLRDYFYDLVNDSDFTTTYGTGVRDALVYIIDLTPLLILFAVWALVAITVVHQIKSGL